MGVCRNEIYTCNLKNTYKYTISGLHPVVVVSSFKHLLKNNTVQVLPITSNVKKICKSHISIEGFGLDLNSKILCEMIVTVNKSDLQAKIGKIDNVKMHEVNSVLKSHLQLNNKHKNLNVEDLQEIFFRGNEMNNNLRELKITESEIYTLYLKKEYNLCIEKCNELIESTNKSTIDDKNSFLWYSNNLKCNCNIKLNNMDLANINAEDTIKYIKEVNILDGDFCSSMWNLARTNEVIDVEKSIKIYNKLSELYEEVYEDKFKISCLFNSNRLQNNILEMQKLIDIVKEYKCETWYYNIDKNEILTEMKKELDALKSI